MARPQMESKTIPVGCFAPPLSDKTLAEYKELIKEADGEIKDELEKLLTCVSAWWHLPEPKKTGREPRLALLHRGEEMEVPIIPMDPAHVEKLDPVTPYMRELNTLSNEAGTGLFDRLRAGPLRECAFHLLWFAKEITLDREPLTQDKLPE